MWTFSKSANNCVKEDNGELVVCEVRIWKTYIVATEMNITRRHVPNECLVGTSSMVRNEVVFFKLIKGDDVSNTFGMIMDVKETKVPTMLVGESWSLQWGENKKVLLYQQQGFFHMN